VRVVVRLQELCARLERERERGTKSCSKTPVVVVCLDRERHSKKIYRTRGRRKIKKFEEETKNTSPSFLLSLCPPHRQKLLPCCSAAAAAAATAAYSISAAARSSPGTEARRPRRAADAPSALPSAADRFLLVFSSSSRCRRLPPLNPQPRRSSAVISPSPRPALEDSPDRARFRRRLSSKHHRRHHHHQLLPPSPLLRSSASTTSSLPPGPRAR